MKIKDYLTEKEIKSSKEEYNDLVIQLDLLKVKEQKLVTSDKKDYQTALDLKETRLKIKQIQRKIEKLKSQLDDEEE